MPASAASNSGAVCESKASSKPRGAKSRAIAPASADGGTKTIFAIATSDRVGLPDVASRPQDNAPNPMLHANPTGLGNPEHGASRGADGAADGQDPRRRGDRASATDRRAARALARGCQRAPWNSCRATPERANAIYQRLGTGERGSREADQHPRKARPAAATGVAATRRRAHDFSSQRPVLAQP